MVCMRDLMKKTFFITLTCSAQTLNLFAKNLKIPGVTFHAIKVIKYFRNNYFVRAKGPCTEYMEKGLSMNLAEILQKGSF